MPSGAFGHGQKMGIRFTSEAEFSADGRPIDVRVGLAAKTPRAPPSTISRGTRFAWLSACVRRNPMTDETEHLHAADSRCEPFMLDANGWVPNNARLPVLLWRGVIDGAQPDGARPLRGAVQRQWLAAAMARRRLRLSPLSLDRARSARRRDRPCATDFRGPGRADHLGASRRCTRPARARGIACCRARDAFWSSALIRRGSSGISGAMRLLTKMGDDRMEALPIPSSDPVGGAEGEVTRLWH